MRMVSISPPVGTRPAGRVRLSTSSRVASRSAGTRLPIGSRAPLWWRLLTGTIAWIMGAAFAKPVGRTSRAENYECGESVDTGAMRLLDCSWSPSLRVTLPTGSRYEAPLQPGPHGRGTSLRRQP